MPSDKTWNQRLVHAMNARNVNQTQLAKAVGVSNPTVHAWMNDQETLKADNKAKIDFVLKLPSGYLIEGSCGLDDEPVSDLGLRLDVSEVASTQEVIDLATALPRAVVVEMIRSLVKEMTLEERVEIARIALSSDE